MAESGNPHAAADLASATAELRNADPPPVPIQAGVSSTPAPSAPALPGTLPGGATLNYYLDGY